MYAVRTAAAHRIPGDDSPVKAFLTLLLAGLTLLTGGVVLATNADAATSARIIRWKDGDTVLTTRGTVRLIGMDTPERGQCGYTRATQHAARIAPPGSSIDLVNPASVQDRDRYQRLLRYVQTRSGRDVGLSQIIAGARARYDSQDGYQYHPRQRRYHHADNSHANYTCNSPGTANLRSYPPASTWNCPPYAPIKGNRSSMIYHKPGQAYYAATTPEQCFATAAAAEHAGYRAAKI